MTSLCKKIEETLEGFREGIEQVISGATIEGLEVRDAIEVLKKTSKKVKALYDAFPLMYLSQFNKEFQEKLLSLDPQVTKLNLGINNIGDEEVKAIAEILKDSQVTVLNLMSNNIGDEGAKAIAEVLKDSQVTKLNLLSNDIGYEGAKALAEVLKDSQVTVLNLMSNNIGDEGAKAIAEILKDSQVTKLNLGNNNIGAKGDRKSVV